MIKVILTLIIIISLIALLFITLYTKILVSKTRVAKAEKEIEDELNKRYKIIKEMKPIIEKSTKKDIKDFKELEDLKKTNVSTFDMDCKIEKTIQTINIIRTDYPKLEKKKEFKEFVTKLDESTTYINAAKSYFNSYNKNLNALVKKAPTNIMCLIMKIKKRPFYEGKNIFSDIDI